MTMRSETKKQGRVTVFHLRDDLTTDKIKPFLKKITGLMDEGRFHLILDLADVHHICLLGMVAISSLFNKCRQAGGSLKVCHLNAAVRRSFKTTNLINTVECFDDILDAIKSFESQNLLKRKNYSGSFFIKEKNAFVGWERLPMTGPVH